MLYKYKCDTCNNAYIGKTKNHLIVRQYEHLGKSIATDKLLRYSDKDSTAIRNHSHSLDNLASIDNFSILGNAMKPSFNAARESIPLYLFDS